jgi:type IV secretion system protein TrbG
LRLISKTDDYMARLAFQYPDDELPSKWPVEATREAELDPILPLSNFIESLYTNYRFNGGDKNIRPVRVIDDGVKTYIQMSDSMLHREAPALVITGPDGKPEMVNYRVNGRTYIVDRLFDRAALILGAGKKTRKVEIVRDHPPKH